MLENFQRSGHPIFRCTSALERGHWKNKEGGRTTIQFTASDDNVQLILKMVITVNQLSLYGAEADLIRELPVDQRAPRKPVALGQMEQEILTQPPFAEVQAGDERQWDLLQDYEQRFEKLQEDQKLSKLCSAEGGNLVEVGQLFYALPSPNGAKNHSLCREHTLPRDVQETCAKGWIEGDARFGPASDISLQETWEIRRWS